MEISSIPFGHLPKKSPQIRIEAVPPIENILNAFSSLSANPYAALIFHERHVILAEKPFLIFKSRSTRIEIQLRDGPIWNLQSNHPMKELNKIFSSYASDFSENPFFQGGLIGYFGYDLARTLENIPSLSKNDLDLPDIEAAFYDTAYTWDRQKNEAHWIALALNQETPQETQKKIDAFKKSIQGISGFRSSVASKTYAQPWKSNFSKINYLQAVQKVKDYIASGDIYQANLSQRFETEMEGEIYPLFKEMLRLNPARFSSFFHTPETTLLSLSPERFIRIEGRQASTHPIKGTRSRGQNASEDEALKKELLNSPKDAAELLMIVDLERNDLGKACEYGSVRVASAKTLETHPQVFHLSGAIQGDLKPDISHIECLEKMFPGGSITGAPKLRAMQIIEELEPNRRNLYTGCLGYMGFNGISDLSILIRTLTRKNNRLYFQVGGGIVADSLPEAEYLETLTKGKIFFDVLNPNFDVK
jgi:para-aminobenzoate synthetase component 1